MKGPALRPCPAAEFLVGLRGRFRAVHSTPHRSLRDPMVYISDETALAPDATAGAIRNGLPFVVEVREQAVSRQAV